MVFYGTMKELHGILAGKKKDVPLDVVALQIATIEYPKLEIEPFLALLDSYGREFDERLSPSAAPDEFVESLNEYLFDELGFRGNESDYYNPANSCLNDVLLERTGIPITLSVLYMEIARRVDRRLVGVGLPGHFLVKYAGVQPDLFIDPFNGGRILFASDCQELAASITGSSVTANPALLAPVSKRQIALRMLNNLRAVYFRNQDAAKAVRVLDLLIEALPEAHEEYKQRGICLAQLQHFHDAKSDLETYLRLRPEAPDRQQIKAHIFRLNSYLTHGT